MRELTVTEKDCAQQLIKYLSKYMEEAPKSFFYKMLRKKNIVLNQKKADGSEKLKTGDTIRLYLAEETIEKFRKTPEKPAAGKQVKYPKLDIVYEDEKVIFLNKPAGVLSQKAKETDVSLTEALGAYLSGKNAGEETMFRAGLCNRLDRNTPPAAYSLFRHRAAGMRFLCKQHLPAALSESKHGLSSHFL